MVETNQLLDAGEKSSVIKEDAVMVGIPKGGDW